MVSPVWAGVPASVAGDPKVPQLPAARVAVVRVRVLEARPAPASAKSVRTIENVPEVL